MARGLLTGALFFLSITLVMIIMILWPDSPWSTWLMEKTELGDDFCWFGEGIWRTNIVWGESFRDLRCVKHGTRESDALDMYCPGGARHNAEMFDNPDQMCSVTKWGRFFMSFGAILSFIGAFLVIAVHFTTSLETRQLRLRRAAVVLFLSFICHATLFLLMATSPLFDTYHFSFLGKDNRVNYKGLGCVFQSPFVGGIISLVSSSPLKCLYPGPALPLTIGIVIFQFMACLMIFLLLSDTRSRIAKTAQQREQGLDEPLLTQQREEPQKRRSCCEYLFGTGAQDYHYSLHGAFLRRLSKFHRLEQNLVGVLVPMVVLGNGMLLVSWFYHGMQFLVHVRVHNQTILKAMNGSTVAAPLTAPDIKEFTIVELREQVFTFDPVTSLKDFWDSRGYLLTFITALWLDFFPFLKIFLWQFYWFVPQSEIIRGRVLTWIDYLGKWSLANLFTLCIIATGFLFKSSIMLPIPLPLHQSIMLELECILESGAGVTWFIFSLLWTIAMGDVFLQFHTLARDWEEERRCMDSQQQQNLPHQRENAPRAMESTSTLVFEHDYIPESLRTVGAFEDDTPVPTPQLQSGAMPSSALSGSTAMSSSFAPPILGRLDETRSSPAGSIISETMFRMTPLQQQQPTRTSLVREIVRRTSAQFILSPNGLRGPKQSLEGCDFAPIRSQRHRFSSKGKVSVWCALIISLALVGASLAMPVIHFRKLGAVPDVLLDSQEELYSAAGFISTISNAGATERPAYELALAFALFGIVFPIVHAVALFFLWAYPMTAAAQLRMFRFVEFCDAWNALDVFFVGCFVVWVGLESISKSVVEIVVPGLTAAVRTFFGESDIFVIIPQLRYGFWCIGLALFAQKMVSHVLMELTAATIAQRQYALQRGEVFTSPGGSTQYTSIHGPQHQQALSQEQLLLFSPAARYVGVSGVDSTVFYAGLPMWVWRFGVAVGLMDVSED